MKTKNEIPDTDNSLREALRRMVEDTAPAAGWEERVLAEAPKPRRRLWLVPGIGAAAAAIAAIAVMTGGPSAVREQTDAASACGGGAHVLMIAQAPEAPSVVSAPMPARHVAPRCASGAEAPLVVLPEPLAMSETEISDIDIPVAEYIDDLLARNLAIEQALVTSAINPFEDTSYTPLF